MYDLSSILIDGNNNIIIYVHNGIQIIKDNTYLREDKAKLTLVSTIRLFVDKTLGGAHVNLMFHNEEKI